MGAGGYHNDAGGGLNYEHYPIIKDIVLDDDCYGCEFNGNKCNYAAKEK